MSLTDHRALRILDHAVENLDRDLDKVSVSFAEPRCSGASRDGRIRIAHWGHWGDVHHVREVHHVRDVRWRLCLRTSSHSPRPLGIFIAATCKCLRGLGIKSSIDPKWIVVDLQSIWPVRLTETNHTNIDTVFC
jgi:hypothetical protein